MSRSKLTVLVRSLTLLASVGAPCLASAADLLPPPPPMPAPPPVEVGGGWYLRGDVGVGATEIGGLRTTVDNLPSLPSNYEIASSSFGDSYFAGAGIGYQFNSFIRGDVTAEYRGFGQFRFVERFDQTGLGSRDGIDTNSGKFRSIVLMANGYFDLGTWFCLTPYIGGGVGTAFHQVSGFIDQGAAATPGFGYAKTKETNSLAWNLQAGITYDVTPNFKVDVGYRYMNLGSAKTGVVECLGPASCPGAHYKFADITSHDVKIGVRYLLGGAVAAMPALAPDYAPGPIVRKY